MIDNLIQVLIFQISWSWLSLEHDLLKWWKILLNFFKNQSTVFPRFTGSWGSPGSSAGKESTCSAGDPSLISWVQKIPWRRDINWLPWWLRWYRICLHCRKPGFDPWIGTIPWRKAWQPTPVLFAGESPWTE